MNQAFERKTDECILLRTYFESLTEELANIEFLLEASKFKLHDP